jgi:hypothetical protein
MEGKEASAKEKRSIPEIKKTEFLVKIQNNQ